MYIILCENVCGKDGKLKNTILNGCCDNASCMFASRSGVNKCKTVALLKSCLSTHSLLLCCLNGSGYAVYTSSYPIMLRHGTSSLSLSTILAIEFGTTTTFPSARSDKS